jgi:hypothetical protein
VYSNNTVVLVKTETETSGTNVLIIAIISSIVGLIIVGAGVSYLIYRKYFKAQIDTKLNQINQSSKENMSPGSPSIMGDEYFEEQYHPKSDMSIIFGDPFKHKVNDADDIAVERNSPIYLDRETEGGLTHIRSSEVPAYESMSSSEQPQAR